MKRIDIEAPAEIILELFREEFGDWTYADDAEKLGADVKFIYGVSSLD